MRTRQHQGFEPLEVAVFRWLKKPRSKTRQPKRSRAGLPEQQLKLGVRGSGLLWEGGQQPPYFLPDQHRQSWRGGTLKHAQAVDMIGDVRQCFNAKQAVP